MANGAPLPFVNPPKHLKHYKNPTLNNPKLPTNKRKSWKISVLNLEKSVALPLLAPWPPKDLSHHPRHSRIKAIISSHCGCFPSLGGLPILDWPMLEIFRKTSYTISDLRILDVIGFFSPLLTSNSTYQSTQDAINTAYLTSATWCGAPPLRRVLWHNQCTRQTQDGP